jgi:Glycosyltransferase family 9 (heptosyltransferase)
VTYSNEWSLFKSGLVPFGVKGASTKIFPWRWVRWAKAMDRRRSLSLDQFARFADIPGVSFVSLQKGKAAAQTRSPPSRMIIHDWTHELDDFADTAALIEALDLVISVDTAVAHLAGALGKPVWLLNRFDTCWRWMLDREDSPWYPGMRLFRQPKPGDWDSVLAKVREELANWHRRSKRKKSGRARIQALSIGFDRTEPKRSR